MRHAHPDDAPIIDRWLADHGRKDDSVRWLPLMALKDEMVVAVDADWGVLPIEPVW